MFKRHFSNFFERVEHAGCPASPTLSTKSALEPEQAISRPLADAIELATKLMREHGLTGWRVKLDHARRRAGQCDYNTKVISLSRLYVRNAEKNHIRDTILHEIAHALVGPHHGQSQHPENNLINGKGVLRKAEDKSGKSAGKGRNTNADKNNAMFASSFASEFYEGPRGNSGKPKGKGRCVVEAQSTEAKPNRQNSAKGGGGAYADNTWFGQRVAKKALQAGASHAKSKANNQTHQSSGHAKVPKNDCIGGGFTVERGYECCKQIDFYMPNLERSI